MSKTGSKARKRLALDEVNPKSSGIVKQKRILKGNDFQPKFERPQTRSANGIEMLKRIISPELSNKSSKDTKHVKLKNGNKVKRAKGNAANEEILH